MPKYLINTEYNNIKDNAISLKHIYNLANLIEYYFYYLIMKLKIFK